jgi:hypothetical protein
MKTKNKILIGIGCSVMSFLGFGYSASGYFMICSFAATPNYPKESAERQAIFWLIFMVFFVISFLISIGYAMIKKVGIAKHSIENSNNYASDSRRSGRGTKPDK